MRNITITLDDDVARWARVWAAGHDTSLSAMVSRTLVELRERENQYDSAMVRFLNRKSADLSQGNAYPGRDSLYDR